MRYVVGKCILIVEDQEPIGDVLARRFSRRGFEVVECTNPLEALACVRSRPVHLIITDIDLKHELTGVDFFKTISSEGFRQPVIFLTGHDEENELVQGAVLAGASAVFSKPTEFSVLLAKVCELLDMTADAAAIPGIR